MRKRDLVTGQRRMGPSAESETVSVLSPYGESKTAFVFFGSYLIDVAFITSQKMV